MMSLSIIGSGFESSWVCLGSYVSSNTFASLKDIFFLIVVAGIKRCPPYLPLLLTVTISSTNITDTKRIAFIWEILQVVDCNSSFRIRSFILKTLIQMISLDILLQKIDWCVGLDRIRTSTSKVLRSCSSQVCKWKI